MGHVSACPLPQEGPGPQLSGREHRGAGAVHPDLSPARLGRLGEAVAAHFLQSRGATIEARNLRVGTGELDLVVNLDGLRVGVEVKTVSGTSEPLDAFDLPKHHQVRDLAAAAGCDRVDLIAIRVSESGAEVRWLPHVE